MILHSLNESIVDATTLRDTLLPKLQTGELSVVALESKLGGSA
jgi:hypothetical protein